MRSVRIKRVEFREKCEAFHYSGTKKTVPVNNALSELRGCLSRGGVYCRIWAIQVCAAVKGMVFKQFTLR